MEKLECYNVCFIDLTEGKPGTGTSSESVSNMDEKKAKELPSFWIPALTPDSKPTLVKKPVSLYLYTEMRVKTICRFRGILVPRNKRCNLHHIIESM